MGTHALFLIIDLIGKSVFIGDLVTRVDDHRLMKSIRYLENRKVIKTVTVTQCLRN